MICNEELKIFLLAKNCLGQGLITNTSNLIRSTEKILDLALNKVNTS
jgi:hypothetical protein